ncbi:Outer envelope protein 61 [Vitis vinifera]|uniref:Outer envelope protein 61 n=1 Tax=Vitis vinifera TaxID=29760 RepID=A0A438D5Y8_VITVI|nr:Outer envelope protein 61 [Vitis vinifera]
MHNSAMMDPELIRLAQEQMNRMSPTEFAKIQEQMMANPELMRMASETMMNMRPEDLRNAAEQLKYARPEEMAEIGEKMANSSPEEIAAMRARADSQITYQINAAQMLKKQGNELHNKGKFNEASQKYLLAKKNLTGIPASKGRTLLLACSLNLMSCYLKTKQYDECIQEGTEVLAYDPKNVKALYRRGQAYKELGQLNDAVSDLNKAYGVSPEDETIGEVLREPHSEEPCSKGPMFVEKDLKHYEELLVAEQEKAQTPVLAALYAREQLPNNWVQYLDFVMFFIAKPPSYDSTVPKVFNTSERPNYPRDVKEKLIKQGGEPAQRKLVIEEITEEAVSTGNGKCSAMENCVTQPQKNGACRKSQSGTNGEDLTTNSEYLQTLKDDPEAIRSFQNFMSNADPDTLAALSAGKSGEYSPDMFKTASNMISKMSPEELQRMVQMASSFQRENEYFPKGSLDSNFGSFRPGSVPPNLTPEMLKTATDMMNNMSTEERQKMLEMASSLRARDSVSTPASLNTDGLSSKFLETRENSAVNGNNDMGESSSHGSFSNLRSGSQSSFQPSTAGMQEQMRNQMKDPAMRQDLCYDVKNWFDSQTLLQKCCACVGLQAPLNIPET